MNSDNHSNAAAIIEAITEQQKAEILDLTKIAPGAAAVPVGVKLVSLKPLLDEYSERPDRKKGTATLTVLESFIAHVNRSKHAHSALFADISGPNPRIVAVYDYNEANEGEPNFGQHRAVYPFPLSLEWVAWNSTASASVVRGMSQAEFAEFLEAHVMDVVAPDAELDATWHETFDQLGMSIATPAQLLALSRGLKLRVDCEVTQRPILSTGEMELSYKETHAANGGDGVATPLKVPGAFLLAIPVFTNGPRYKIGVRLRYRVAGGKVTWSFLLHRADVALNDAMIESCDQVTHETSVPLFFGFPEGHG